VSGDFVYPELLEVGPFTLYSYGVLLAVSYVLGLWLATRRARRWGLDPHRVLDLGIYVIIAGLMGAKLLLLVVKWDDVPRAPEQWLSLARSGGVFYGGLLLAVVMALWLIGKHDLPRWSTCDVCAPGIALGHVTGRLGCFAAGCCYGTATTVPWAVVFTSPVAAANVGTPLGIPLHPTQLYEAAAELVVLGILLGLERRGPSFAGRTFWLYMLLYAVSRYGIEIFRGDPRGTVLGVLSTSQFISLLLAPLSVAMLVWLSRTAPRNPTVGRSHGAVAAW